MRDSGYERQAEDFYCEPPWAVEGLLSCEHALTGMIWDPCCGCGNIPEVLKLHGHMTVATDLIARGYGCGGVDFFTSATACSSIVSNPPYGRAQAFIERAIELTNDRVCVLLRLAFLEGQGRWAELFQHNPPARVWVSKRRMSMPPGGTDIVASGGTIAYAWFVWDHHAQRDETRLGWF